MSDVLLRTALRALSPAGRGGRLSIVIFHRVLPAPDPLFPDDMDRDRFSRALRLAGSPGSTCCRWTKRCADRPKAACPSAPLAITFDDGYADNHDIAMPILRAHGLSATFFIATGFLDGGRMWNDTVVESIRRCSATDAGPVAAGAARRWQAGTGLACRPGGKPSYKLLDATKYLPIEQRQATADRIASLAGATLPNDLMMSFIAGARACLAGGMQIGAHTINHPILARLDDAQAEAEIAGGKAALEALIQQPVTLFAYPNGKPGQDYQARDVSLVRKAGFSSCRQHRSRRVAAGDGRPLPAAALHPVGHAALGLRCPHGAQLPGAPGAGLKARAARPVSPPAGSPARDA